MVTPLRDDLPCVGDVRSYYVKQDGALLWWPEPFFYLAHPNHKQKLASASLRRSIFQGLLFPYLIPNILFLCYCSKLIAGGRPKTWVILGTQIK